LIVDYEAKYGGDAQKIGESGTIILPYRIMNLTPLNEVGLGIRQIRPSKFRKMFL